MNTKHVVGVASFMVALGFSGVASATLYPSQWFPGSYGRSRLAGWDACLETAYGQMKNVCTSTVPMSVASWSAHEILWAPALDAFATSSPVSFATYAYATSTATNNKVGCEVLVVGIDGWPDAWSGRRWTTTTGWQTIDLGWLTVTVDSPSVIVECLIGYGGIVGSYSSIPAAGA